MKGNYACFHSTYGDRARSLQKEWFRVGDTILKGEEDLQKYLRAVEVKPFDKIYVYHAYTNSSVFPNCMRLEKIWTYAMYCSMTGFGMEFDDE